MHLVGVLSRLLKDLHAAGIITEDLALPEDPDDLEAIYRGLCRVPKEGSRRRRIDFLTVPWRSRGAALLYYTVCMLHLTHFVNSHFPPSRVTILYDFFLLEEGKMLNIYPLFP